MDNVRVWAPFANDVELHLGTEAENQAMIRQDDGWWKSVSTLAHAQDYMFLIDGKGPFPDPRSPWQPKGIHNTSRMYDHTLFHWEADQWAIPALENAIIYELHIGTFTVEGTFDSAVARLDYLVELGITHICLMPIAAFSGRHGWGYDGVQLYAPHSAYGTPDQLKKFIDACHRKRLAVIIDVVYNHLGPTGNYLASYGPYFTNRYRTPWGEAINFDDQYSDEVRQFFIDNALTWLQHYRFDGLRLDAVHAIFDSSAEHFLEALTNAVKALEQDLRRPLTVIAESDLNDPRLLHPKSKGGYNIDSQWCDDLHHSVHAFFTSENQGYYTDFGKVSDIVKALQQAYVYDGNYSTFRKRKHGALPEGLRSKSFVVYTQTHDQVGNRARGERLSQLLPPDQLKLAAALALTSPFVAMIFQGEEWAASTPFLYFTDHQEQALGQAVSEGRQQEFQSFGWAASEVPDPQNEETFRKSKLKWRERQQQPHVDMYRWYQQLIAFRKKNPELFNIKVNTDEIEFDEAQQWLTVHKQGYACHFNLNSIQRRRLEQEQPFNIVLNSNSATEVKGNKLNLMPASMVIVTA